MINFRFLIKYFWYTSFSFLSSLSDQRSVCCPLGSLRGSTLHQGTTWQRDCYIGDLIRPFLPKLCPLSVNLATSCGPNGTFHFLPIFIKLLGDCFYYIMWIMLYWDHEWFLFAGVTALCKSGQILLRQPLQFSTDFLQNFRILLSLHDLDHGI